MVNTEKDSYLYGVDHGGRVWYMDLHNNGSGQQSMSSASSVAPPHWSLLPNPTRVDIKRLSSRGSVIWGISSDHQIHVYAHKQDIPVRVREETYENQRWNPVGGFCDELLPTDRPHFSSADGLEARPRNAIKLPSAESWTWEADWQIENTFQNQLLDAEGWTYAWDFPVQYHAEKSWKSCVRRRKWFRIRRFTGFNRWLRVEPIHPDHTQEPFTDVCVNTYGSSPELRCVWAVTVLGQVYFRAGVTQVNPEGTKWEHVPIRKGLEACQVTVAANGTPFVVAWTGSCLYRMGLTPQALTGVGWVESNGPEGGLLQLSAGETSLWAVTRDRKCWILKGNLQPATNNPGTPFEWIEIPGKMKSISVSNSDQVVLGMSGEDDSALLARFGITEAQKHGQGWREAFPRLAWDTLSTTSSEVSTSASASQDQADSGHGDSESLCSIRPDAPPGLQLQSTEINDLENENLSFCWVDGSCLSQLRPGMEGDLEVGPWREEILNGLQSLRLAETGFAYPNALDDTGNWQSKSVPARLLQHGQETHWIKGGFEIVNNDTIVFHKDLTHTWYCGLRDILSVLRTREISLSFTLRIRNPIEAGVADFVTFKFENEKDLEEWCQVVTEFSTKPSEEFSISNLWLTTTHGELHNCGMLKMADTAVGADMEIPSDSGFSTHHPLIKGFLPGSTLKVDISVPAEPSRFSLNLEGRSLVAFHFNPRFTENVVVRNTKRNGDWGSEERDGVFPFRPLHTYCVTLECTDTHFITTVSIQRKQFIFKYRHRVLPKFITNFSAGGDVVISGIRYDPKTGDSSSQPEFVSSPVPGHFWKVEGTPNGFTWALGFDSNVWVYTQGTRRKSEEALHVVTDDQVVYIYENQRWNPLTGFGSHGLPTDRSHWSDETGRVALEKDNVKLLSRKWTWLGDWEVDYNVTDGVDKSGWQYAVDFPASYHSSKRFNDFVRRRRWKRTCRYTVNGPWVHVPGAQLVDLSVGMNEDCDWEVLGVCMNGDVVVRCGVSPEVPMGSHWESVHCDKPFISISAWFGQRAWGVGKDGFAYIRYAHNWQLLDRPKDSPLKTVRVGPSGVWAVGTNNVLYRRSDVMPILPEGREWVRVCEGVTLISLGLGEEVWALLKKGDTFHSTLAKRMGISKNNPSGIGWENVAEGPWAHLTITGAYTRNK